MSRPENWALVLTAMIVLILELGEQHGPVLATCLIRWSWGGNLQSSSPNASGGRSRPEQTLMLSQLAQCAERMKGVASTGAGLAADIDLDYLALGAEEASGELGHSRRVICRAAKHVQIDRPRLVDKVG